MKVHELKEHLNKLDPELDVLCISEDERLLDEKQILLCSIFYLLTLPMRY